MLKGVNDKMISNRETYLDIAKGIGILLVVVGHCIPDASSVNGISSPIMKIIFQVIYSFHMPLFFFISGFLFSASKDSFKNKYKSIYKKAKRLIVPYVFVGLCYAPLKLLLSQFANKPYNIHDLWKMLIGINPDGELWFLYALFIIIVIAIIFEGGYNSKTILMISLIFTFCDLFLPIVTKNAFYFFLGTYIRNNTCCLFDKNLKIASIHFIVFVSANLMQQIFGYYPAGHIVTAVSGIYLTLFISGLLANIHNKATVILTTLGVYSMDVYILSDIIKIPFRIIFWNKLHLYYVSFFVCTFLSLLLSYYISHLVIRKNSLLKKLILGE